MSLNASDIEQMYDIERIDRDARMERIRQSGAKLSWNSYSLMMKKSFMDKQKLLDADHRKDMLTAVSILRKSLPVDETASIEMKLRQISEGLECQFTRDGNLITLQSTEVNININVDNDTVCSVGIGLFGRPLESSDEARDLLNSGKFVQFRSAIYGLLAVVPNVSSADRLASVTSLELMEHELTSQCEKNATIAAIRTLSCGWVKRRSAIHPTRIYYWAEPVNFNAVLPANTIVQLSDLNRLPYLELSVVYCDPPTMMPSPDGDRSLNASFSIQLSSPMIFCQSVWIRIQRLCSRPSVIRQHLNIAKYLTDFDFQESNLQLRTAWNDVRPEHVYEISGEYLKEERDVVVGEICLANYRDLAQLIALIRLQAMYNSLWESILASCEGKKKRGHFVKMRIEPDRTWFNVMFTTIRGETYAVRFSCEKDKVDWNVEVSLIGPQTDTGNLSQTLTDKLRQSFSLPMTMAKMLDIIGYTGQADPPEEKLGWDQSGYERHPVNQ